MRRSCALLAETMELLLECIEPGMRTVDLDRIAEEHIRDHGGLPAFKGYRGFPATLCVSINEVVVHGIPGNREMREGDLIGIDCGAILDGWFSDMARTVYLGGKPPKKTAKLMKVTKRAFEKGMDQMREGRRLGDVSHAVQMEAESNGFSVVRALVGHGIGREMHEDPQVPNYGPPNQGPKLRNGMVFAIEPMVNVGTHEVRALSDGWTVVTRDNALSAHYENTVAITPDGPEILTRPATVKKG